MTADQYTEALAKARRELAVLVQKRADLDKRISTLHITIEGLATLSEPNESAKTAHESAQKGNLQELGITDAIRAILGGSQTHMTAPQIRNALADRGYDVDRFASILTVIHNTIKRMDDQGEIFNVQDPSGRFLGWMYKRLADRVTSYPSRFNPRDPLGRLNRSRYGGRYQGPVDSAKLPSGVGDTIRGPKKEPTEK